MNEKHGLTEGTLTQIQQVLARFSQVEKAVLFGSRAKGVARRGSDIDVALYGEGLDWRLLGHIDDALDDLLLPYCFSLLHHHGGTDSEVAAHIARVGVPFYRREEGASHVTLTKAENTAPPVPVVSQSDPR